MKKKSTVRYYTCTAGGLCVNGCLFKVEDGKEYISSCGQYWTDTLVACSDAIRKRISYGELMIEFL